MTDWDKNHTVSNDKNFVTNSRLSEICTYHGIEIPRSKRVMDIGVGNGATVADLLSLGNEVVAVDVSREALKKITYNIETRLSPDIKESSPVDLALAHLVFQHNHEYEVRRIINDVQLLPKGVFSFQFASLNPKRSRLSELIMSEINSSMLYFYSLKKMEEIVDTTDKTIINVVGPVWFDQPFSFEWYMVQVV